MGQLIKIMNLNAPARCMPVVQLASKFIADRIALG